MTKKQKISLLCGTVAVVFGALNAIFDFYHPGFDIYLVIVVALTAGCIYNFRDKERQTAKDIVDMEKPRKRAASPTETPKKEK